MENTSDVLTTANASVPVEHTFDNVTMPEIVVFSTLFFMVGIVGITGNILVIFIVFSDSKMRVSMTNMLIVNLAVADLCILIFGVPEIVQFMINRGWLLGTLWCKVQRAVLVTSLYTSVMTLLALCIERYIAIVFPIKAHLLCTRRRTLFVIVMVWLLAVVFGTPTLLFNEVVPASVDVTQTKFCLLVFPYEHQKMFILFKYFESVLFYFIPLAVQVICYVIIGKNLFLGMKQLHEQTLHQSPRNSTSKCSDTVKARRGVIKMLIVSVVLYFVSYSPHQILLFYNTFSPQPFNQKWTFLVGVTILAYINSAGNPIIYCLFSERYRQKFRHIFTCGQSETVSSYGDTICLHSSSHATEYTQLFQKSSKRSVSFVTNR